MPVATFSHIVLTMKNQFELGSSIVQYCYYQGVFIGMGMIYLSYVVFTIRLSAIYRLKLNMHAEVHKGINNPLYCG